MSDGRRHGWSGLIAATLACLAMGAFSPATAGQDPLNREIYVPFEDLEVLFEEPSRYVMLDRREYLELLERAGRRSKEDPPVEALLASAKYEITVAGERAVINGELSVHVLGEGLQAVELDLGGVGLRKALLDGKAAALGRFKKDPLTLFVEGAGRRSFTLEMTAPLETTAARQVLELTLPVPPATECRLSVPGDVEVQSGAAIVRREYDEARDRTRFDLLLNPGPLELVMSLNSRLKRRNRTVVANSVFIDEITESYERLHGTISLRILHRPVEAFSFSLPDGFEVTTVTSPRLSRWEIHERAKGRSLSVHMREEITGTEVLTLSAGRSNPDISAWRMPRLSPLEVAGHAAVLGVVLDNRLDLRAVSESRLVSLDTAVLARAIPRTVLEAAPGSAPIRPVLAYFAPDGDFDLEAELVRAPSEYWVTTNVLLLLEDGGLEVRGGFAVTPQAEKRFELSFLAPREWEVTAVTDDGESPLGFERYETGEGEDRIHVRLPAGLNPGEVKQIFFRAKHVPAAWFESWQSRRVAFPLFRALDAARDVGAIAVAAGDDLVARPALTEGLTPLDETEKSAYGLEGAGTTLAYRYDGRPYAAEITVERTAPRVTAETFSFLRVDQDALLAHYEIVYIVDRARAHELSFLLPPDTPSAVDVKGMDGLSLKEHFSEEVEGGRRWRAVLAREVSGAVRLAVDFQKPLDPAFEGESPLPVIRAEGVDYQSGFVAVEGSPEREVRIIQSPRRVDIGELAESRYQPGKRVLGIFGFIGEPAPVTVEVRRPAGYAMPPTLVQKEELVTILSPDGVSQSSARYFLRTKALFLGVVLPPRSLLWSAALDGNPMKPQREGDHILFNLPAGAGTTVRTLELVYETSVEKVGSWDSLRFEAPILRLHTAQGDPAPEIPTSDLTWSIHPPFGYRVVSSRGNLVTTQITPPRVAAAGIGEALLDLGGGVGFHKGLIGWLGRLLSVLSPKRAVLLRSDVSLETARAPVELPAGEVGLEEDEAALAPQSMQVNGSVALDHDGRSKERKALKKTVPGWALEGARSLAIDLAKSGEAIMFRSLGGKPELKILLAHRRRVGSLVLALSLAVFLAGTALTRRPLEERTAYVGGALLVSTLVPMVPGLTTWAYVWNGVFLAALLLIPFYILAGIARRVLGRLRRRKSLDAVAAGVAFFLVALPWDGGAVADEKPYVIQVVPPTPPVTVPPDAIIVPYDPAEGMAPGDAEKLFLPYDRYQKLWRRAYPDTDPSTSSPAPFALAGASYKGRLGNKEDLVLEGHLEIDVLTEGYVTVPLPLEGGVLARAELDGEPARLGGMAALDERAVSKAEAGESHVVLHVAGKGRHRLDLAVRLKLNRRGGWRIAEGRVPSAPATSLDLAVPATPAEVRVHDVFDRKSFETGGGGETIHTGVGAGGRVHVEWRPIVGAGHEDQTLTTDSAATLDIREDILRLAWTVGFNFRSGERERFSLRIPRDYLVENVEGTNVKGWELDPGKGDRQSLEVQLLRRAREQETFSIHLWRVSSFAESGRSSLTVPVILAEGAIRQTGHIILRRSPLLAARTETADGITRIDMQEESTGTEGDSPLGLQPYQSYEFSSLPFNLVVSVAPVTAGVTAEIQSLLRVTERERHLESRVQLRIEDRPIYRARLRVPRAFDLKGVLAPEPFEWSVTEDSGDKVVTVFFRQGALGEAAVILRGRLEADDALTEVGLPRVEVIGVSDQRGTLAIQADSSFGVSAKELENIEQVLPERVYGWVAPSERPLVRLAFAFTEPDYAGTVVLEPRRPEVSCYTLTNVRVGDRAIEETILLTFHIAGAGIREVAFLLPDWLADAKIIVPDLREKEVAAVDGVDRVRVRLSLQDEVTRELKVLVEHDRLLTSSEQTAPIPVVETGRTDRRYVALESAGRDEVVVTKVEGLAELSRQQKEWRALADLLQGVTMEAYIAGPDEADPRLIYQTRERAAVETAGARVGLSRASLFLDTGGTYRARQVFHVDNQTEQFLELELPEGATLWTARVAGEPVKPSVDEGKGTTAVRVPLVKTAIGDLDYVVDLKYGGSLDDLGRWETFAFPLVKVSNIHVELSQVELYLPRTHRWIRFGGTMRRSLEEGEFETAGLAYQTGVARRLVDQLDSKNAYTRARALKNLEEVSRQIQVSQSAIGASISNKEVREKINEASQILKAADKQIQATRSAQQAEAGQSDNRVRMNAIYGGQAQERALDQLSGRGYNWSAVTGAGSGDMVVSNEWLDRNALSAGEDAEEEEQIDHSRLEQFTFEPSVQHAGEAGQMRQQAAPEPGRTVQQRVQPKAPAVFKKALKGKKDLAAGGKEKIAQLKRGRRSQAGKAAAYLQKMEEAQFADLPSPVMGFQDQGKGGAYREGADDYGTANFGAVTAGLSSLDVTFPSPDSSRWSPYRFTVPRGDARLSAWALAGATEDWLKHLVLVFAAAGIFVVVRGVRRSAASGRVGKRTLSSLLLAGGVMGLLIGVFPVYAALMLTGAALWKLNLRRA